MTTCHDASRHLDPSARQRHLRSEGVTRRNNYSLLSTGFVQRETSSANKGSGWARQCGFSVGALLLSECTFIVLGQLLLLLLVLTALML